MPGNLFTLRVPYKTPVVDANYMGTKQWTDFMMSLLTAVQSGSVINVTALGAVGKGGDDTAIFQLAVDTAVNQGGGVVFVPAGSYSITTVRVPVGNSPITFMGQGSSTVVNRRGDLAAGAGLFDIFGSNVTFDSLAIDGQTLTPTGLLYNVDFMTSNGNDPMADSLTKNTSIWVHGPATTFLVTRVQIQHTGGYAVLIDAGSGGIEDVQILNCNFFNNRPNLFGVTAGQAIYGSWTGGIYINGDGHSSNPGCVLNGLIVAQCRFIRNTGNCIWSHLYSLDELHEDFQITSNYFLDIGLDGILVGGVDGGVVSGNDFRRIGYTTLTDDDQAVPRWLPNLQATALDSSGLVKGVPYTNNSFTSVNGGAIDADGHGASLFSNNVMRIPYPDEPEYASDSIAISGPNNNGSYSYGINLGNSQNTPYGGRNVSITGNTLINLPGGSVRLYSARDCLVSGNNIVAPDVPKAPPIALGPGGTGVNQRSTRNVVKHNRFEYSPTVAAPFVFEDPVVAPFTSADINQVFGNCPVIGNGMATEFQKDPSSGSPTYLETIWFT